LFTLKEVNIIRVSFQPGHVLTETHRHPGEAVRTAMSTTRSACRRSLLSARAWRRRLDQTCQSRCTTPGSRRPAAWPWRRRSTNSCDVP
jgi:hypothetical protein